MNSFSTNTHSEEETISLGNCLGALLQPEDVVLLIGGLGTGKTTLAKGIIAAATGIHTDEVVSPTFTLLNVFEGRFPVAHADLYRLEQVDPVDIGLEDILESYGALVVEWGERLPKLPDEALLISVSRGRGDDARLFLFQWNSEGPWAKRMAEFSLIFPKRAQGSRYREAGLGHLDKNA